MQAVAFFVVRNFIRNFAWFILEESKRIRQINKDRGIMEVERAFEPRRGSILIERPPLFRRKIKKMSDAFALEGI